MARRSRRHAVVGAIVPDGSPSPGSFQLRCAGARPCVASLAPELCALAVVLSFQRVGTAQAIVYIVVGITLLAVQFVVVKGYLGVVGCLCVLGGQIAAVVGTAWELTHHIAAVKAVQLRQLGFTPTTGVTINLIYSGCAFLLFAWIIIRWYRCRRT